MADYTVIRSNRKTMGIYITKDGSVEVRCPGGVSMREIEKFVAANRHWIEKKRAKMKEEAGRRNTFCVEPGSLLRYMGNSYPLKRVPGGQMGFDKTCFYVPEHMAAQDIKPGVIQIYKLLADKCLKYKVDRYSKIMNLKPLNVKITSAKTRWGSCSGKNGLNFSWRLIMAEEGCIDYVVIHELAHTAEHNHGKRFWALVERYMPDYKTWENKLRELQKKIAAENWDNEGK